MINWMIKLFGRKDPLNNRKVAGGLMGLCVGDALGVPVEFQNRNEMKKVTDMIGNMGFHGQPPGTWSDDSSMTFILTESLCNGYNVEDIKQKFVDWYYYGFWTHDNTLPFDVGNTCFKAISKIKAGIVPSNVEVGEKDEKSNGNGSLMRVLPLAFYLQHEKENRFDIVETVSGITHAHIRSKIACSYYVQFIISLLSGMSPNNAYLSTNNMIMKYYLETHGIMNIESELDHFQRIFNGHLPSLSIDEIRGSGYVVESLEASLWCFLNSTSYEEAVLTAVNLGDDTDTTGAITGGMAGVYYGFEAIPKKWVNKIARKDEILLLANRFEKSIN